MSFLITGLPRSRTAWFAEFMECPHEPVVNMNDLSDINKFFNENEGCSDFSMGFFIDYILAEIKPNILIIERPIDEVEASLDALNLGIPKTDFCKVLQEKLNSVCDEKLILRVNFNDINDRIHEIYNHLSPGNKFPEDRFEKLKNEIIEVDCSAINFSGALLQKNISPFIKKIPSNFCQIAQDIPVDDLLNKITDDLWDRNPARLSRFGPHRDSHDIYIRGEDETPYINGEIPWKDHGAPHIPVWFESVNALPEAKKLALWLSASLGAEMIGLILIYKVEPGKMIYPHIDKGWHPDFYDKFNICLQSNDKAAFVYDDEKMVQKSGDVHFFRNDVTHSVINEGDTDHIVMTVCLRFDRGYRCPYSPDGWSLHPQEEGKSCQQVG